MHNTAKWTGEGLSIELDLIMALGTKDPHDAIELDGPVPLKLRIEGGTPGDTATVASLVNFTRVLPHCTPGLKTMLDVPVAGAARKSREVARESKTLTTKFTNVMKERPREIFAA